MENDDKITVSKKISGDQDGDATLFGSMLTNHTQRLFEMTQSPEKTLRFGSLELLSVLLRQGLVNPNEAVPFLFALQGDIENPAIRSLALKLLMTEGARRPDMLRQRVCAGAKQAYAFQKSAYATKGTISAVVNVRRGRTVATECIFDSVFKEGVASIRKQRHGLFSNLLSLFEIGEENIDAEVSENDTPRRRRRKSKSKAAASIKDLDLLSFASQILAHLPYTAVGDPLFIIHKLDSIVTLQGAELIDRFASVLRTVGLGEDALDELNVGEDALERAAKSKFPSRTNEATLLSKEKFDFARFTRLCNEGAALILLLRLKSFLRRLFNLSESRMQEYDPTAKGKHVVLCS